ncbi:MAG: hypothetical protein ACE5R6_19090 [Candidatus Heimdallarchaeota archaeon]
MLQIETQLAAFYANINTACFRCLMAPKTGRINAKGYWVEPKNISMWRSYGFIPVDSLKRTRYSVVAFVGKKPTWNIDEPDPKKGGRFDRIKREMVELMPGSLVVDWVFCRGDANAKITGEEIRNCQENLQKLLIMARIEAVVATGKGVRRWFENYWPKPRTFVLETCEHPSDPTVSDNKKRLSVKDICAKWIDLKIL